MRCSMWIKDSGRPVGALNRRWRNPKKANHRSLSMLKLRLIFSGVVKCINCGHIGKNNFRTCHKPTTPAHPVGLPSLRSDTLGSWRTRGVSHKVVRVLRIPRIIIDSLEDKNIHRLMPIQVQSLPCIPARRVELLRKSKVLAAVKDTGYDKETYISLVGHQGPFSLIIGPSLILMGQSLIWWST